VVEAGSGIEPLYTDLQSEIDQIRITLYQEITCTVFQIMSDLFH
jgi:hypothetical protein